MSDSLQKVPLDAKPEKPYPDFPLFPHATRRWAKKIKGTMHYFGPWSDPDGALALYERQRKDLEAGRKPRVSSAKRAGVKKPKKPTPDFPLFPHASGRWAKKVKARFHYFGPWSDPQTALEEWLRVKDDLLAGRVPRPKDQTGTDLDRLVNVFLGLKAQKVDTGEIKQATFEEYKRTLKAFLDYFGRHRLASDITPAEFEGFRAHIAKGLSLPELGKRVQFVRSCYRYAVEGDLLDKSPKFGEFRRPTTKAIRRERAGRPSRMIEPADLQAIIKAAPVPLKAMILLGVNCGFGAGDLSDLPMAAMDLDGGFVTFARPKTGIPRRCSLWPETIQAVTEALEARPDPVDQADTDCVFITKYHRRWVRYQPSRKREGGTRVDAIQLQYGKLLRKLKLHRPGASFYGLRHIHRTVADQVNDRPAADYIMGHSDPNDMAERYVQRVDDSRLQAVTNHIRKWLFPETAAKPQAKKTGKRARGTKQVRGTEQPALRLVGNG